MQRCLYKTALHVCLCNCADEPENPCNNNLESEGRVTCRYCKHVATEAECEAQAEWRTCPSDNVSAYYLNMCKVFIESSIKGEIKFTTYFKML